MRLAVALIVSVPLAAQTYYSNWNTDPGLVGVPDTVVATSLGIRNLNSFSDGYVYIGSLAGPIRAALACLKSNAGSWTGQASCWSVFGTGYPTDGSEAESFAITSTGKILCSWTGTANHFGIFDPSTGAWTITNPFTGTAATAQIAVDASDNIYMQQGSGILKSTNGGTSFTMQGTGNICGSDAGVPNAGKFFDIAVLGTPGGTGKFWFGGECPNISVDLGFSAYTINLPSSNGGGVGPMGTCANGGTTNCFQQNMRQTISDGGLGTGSQSEIIALFASPSNAPSTARYCWRYDVPTTTWASCVIPSTATTQFQFWELDHISKGPNSGEYYIVGHKTGSNDVSLIFGSHDSGVNWAPIGAAAEPFWNCGINNGNCVRYVSVATDGTRFFASQGNNTSISNSRLTNIICDGANSCTLTFSNAHGLVVPNRVYITGSTAAALDGTWATTSLPSASTAVVTIPGSAAATHTESTLVARTVTLLMQQSPLAATGGLSISGAVTVLGGVSQ